MTRTISDVLTHITHRRDLLDQAPFLRNLATSTNLDAFRAFVPHLHFFVFGFQDMLRIAHERVEHPQLRELARRHREEDAGHEQWFVFDVRELGCDRDILWVFGKDHRVTRDVTYGLVAEALKANDDRVRVVFPLVLEAAGSLFFPRVVQFIERVGMGERLRYFARSHQEVEADHDIFSEESRRVLDTFALDPATYDEAIGLVDRCFDLCERLTHHLEKHRLAATG